MRWIVGILLGVWIVTPVAAYDGEYELRSSYVDFDPEDGFMDAGSFHNPYGVYEHGERVGEVGTRYPDFDPRDGFLDPGSYANPYVFRVEE